MNNFINLLNDNQGVIDAIGLILVIPLAIFSERVLSQYKRRQNRKNLISMLLHELWVNLSFVAQIEESYENNFKDENAHIPYFPPRTAVLDKFFQYDLLTSLNKSDQQQLAELYYQLVELRREYFEWRELVFKTPIKRDEEVYKITSQFILNYIGPVMQNAMDLWIRLVDKHGANNSNEKIQGLNKKIKKLAREGKWIKAYYKASYVNKYKLGHKLDVVFCWINDLKEDESDYEIIEIKNDIVIHDSWKD